jgi:3-polyprenyl-4-hydroxybenzoate decarboxylase
LIFRQWIETLRADGKLTEAKKTLSSHLEAAAFIKALEPKDPSADPETRKTAKVGFDATKPFEVEGKNFEKAKFPEVDWRRFT